MKAQAKLFTAPKALGRENDRANIRAKYFSEEYGPLAKEWNEKLVNAGMDADQVFESSTARDSASAYSVEAEEQFSLYARWYWVAQKESFEFQRTTVAENKRIWKLFCIHGKNEREIADLLGLPKSSVHDRIEEMQSRCHLDVRAGKLLSTKDSKAEEQDWERLQAIKQKHLALVRSSNFGETLVDSVTDALVPRSIDQDAVDALISVCTSLSLSLGGAK